MQNTSLALKYIYSMRRTMTLKASSHPSRPLFEPYERLIKENMGAAGSSMLHLFSLYFSWLVPNAKRKEKRGTRYFSARLSQQTEGPLCIFLHPRICHQPPPTVKAAEPEPSPGSGLRPHPPYPRYHRSLLSLLTFQKATFIESVYRTAVCGIR